MPYSLRPRPSAPAIVLLAAICLSSFAGAQSERPSFGEEVDVRVVNVDVFVTDKKGRRVPGLSREDFRVFQDGEEVEISNFSRIEGREVSRPVGVRAEELPTSPGGELPQQMAEDLTVVIYIDNSTLTQPHRNRVLGDLATFVERQSGDGVQFMVAVFNPGLEILTPVTTDAAVTTQAPPAA